VRPLGVARKLVGQCLAAVLTAVLADVRLDLGLPGVAETLVTVALLVAAMNAVNLLDNMDGVAASAVGIGAIALAVTAAAIGRGDAMLLGLALAAACAGFLILNLPLPHARTFMGDCGSLPLGLALGAVCVLVTHGGAGMSGAERLAPLGALFLPVLDTIVVLVRRWRARRPLTRGGRDHLAHRLVLGGMSEAMALALLSAIAAVTSATAAVSAHLDAGLGGAVVLAGAFIASVSLLARSPVPSGERTALARSGGAG
jgi:UDP-GlcNAc:undecaprenyl-phosphate GlcNAc-1-phosphate transferase